MNNLQLSSSVDFLKLQKRFFKKMRRQKHTFTKRQLSTVNSQWMLRGKIKRIAAKHRIYASWTYIMNKSTDVISIFHWRKKRVASTLHQVSSAYFPILWKIIQICSHADLIPQLSHNLEVQCHPPIFEQDQNRSIPVSYYSVNNQQMRSQD